MSLLEMLKTIMYGIVEGITEWLPISSTGHMLLLNQILPLQVSKDFWDMFLVVIQLGAILAVCVLFFHNLNPFAPSKSKEERKRTWSMWGKTIVACIPAAAIGIPLDDWMEAHLGGPYVIAAALIFYGILFIVIENHREKVARDALAVQAAYITEAPRARHMNRTAQEELQALEATADETPAQLADKDATTRTMKDLSWKTAMGIGLFQVLSIIPGTSRSGSTIIGGLLLGCSREVAAEFTFYLAIPVMVGASGLRLVKFFLKGNAFTAPEAMTLGVGCVVAFVVSLLAIRFLMSFVKRHDFKPFGWYRIVLGIVVIAFTLARTQGLF